MAYATNIGLGRMADICNLSYQDLSTAAGNYIRLETLKEANDRIANATARLRIFRHFDIDEAVHSSSDGQKFEAAIPTINVRHSAKYFGLNKGVVAYTLLANHVPLNARIIGANEHESHFVFDILFNNATDILPAVQNVRKVPIRRSCTFNELKGRCGPLSRKNSGFLVPGKSGAFCPLRNAFLCELRRNSSWWTLEKSAQITVQNNQSLR